MFREVYFLDLSFLYGGELMSISESLYFVYNGISSKDMGILNVSKSNVLQQEAFLPEREIKEVTIRNRNRPYFQSIISKPLVLDLRFAFENTWDEESIRATARWLYQDYFKEMYFSDNPDRKFYTIYTGSYNLLHNCLKQGYIEGQWRNIDDCSYSSVYSSPIYDLTSNTISGTEIELVNNGDISMPLIINVEIISGSTFSIKNLSDAGKSIIFSDLDIGEILEINTENESISTSKLLSFRYDQMDGEFLNLPRGVSRLLIKGNIKLQFQYQFRLLQS